MRLPWFMHCHGAHGNTMVGVLPTPVGTFVRSCIDGTFVTTWYPMGSEFPGGDTRVATPIATAPSTDDGQRDTEQAVVDFMHAHPVLAMTLAHDRTGGAPLPWERSASGALGTIETEHGLLFQIHHAGKVTLEFLATGSQGARETLGTFADTCDADTLARRVDERARRRIALAEAGRRPARKPS